MTDGSLDLSGSDEAGAAGADPLAATGGAASEFGTADETLEPAHPLASPVSDFGARAQARLSSCNPFRLQILVFLAYYSETIPEASEAARSREVIIKYHTEDDTVALHEPSVPNSGLMQGKMLKRMRIPLAATRLPARELVGIMPPVRPSGPALRAAVPGEHLTWRELVVGEQLALFGRAMRILACDARTRRWYEAQGVAQPHDIVVHAPKPHHMSAAASPVPGGPAVAAAAPVPFYGKRVNPEKRYLEVGGNEGRSIKNVAPSTPCFSSLACVQAMRGSTSATLTRGIEDRAAQFRAHDPRDVLRFKGVYDDRGRAFGDVVRGGVGGGEGEGAPHTQLVRVCRSTTTSSTTSRTTRWRSSR